jgi:hypothetical protein
MRAFSDDYMFGHDIAKFGQIVLILYSYSTVEGTNMTSRVSTAFPVSLVESSSGTGCEINRDAASGNYAINLWGYFPPGWMAAFAAGMAKNGISIIGGTAKKVSAARWEATFYINVPGDALLPHEVDFIALVKKQPEWINMPTIRLEELSASLDGNGSLRVDVKGADQSGFLMAILRNFAFLSLFPAELEVKTLAGRVHDRFWLRGIAGAALSAEAVQAVNDKLRGFVA